MGTRTWGFDMPGASADHAVGPFRSLTSMATLSTAQAAFYNEGSVTATGIALAGVAEDDPTGLSWMGKASLTLTPGSWQTPSVTGLTYSWTQLNAQLQPTGLTYTGTISAMLAHIGTGDHDGYIGLGFGCNNPGLVDFDKAQIGNTGDVTTYDFEADLTKTTISGKPSTLTAGQSATLQGLMTDVHGGAFTSAPLTLQAKAYGATSWTSVGQATETYDVSTQTPVPAVLKKKPLTQTQYRWVYAGSPAAEGSVSTSFTVKVHTALTAKPKATTVSKGGRIVVTGRTTPAKPGMTVRLMKGSTKVGSGIVKTDGTYKIVTKAKTTGTWKLHVVIGAGSGNLAGTSRTFKVVVG
jgi:hypothetical protein